MRDVYKRQDQNVTLQDAVRGILALLGYKDEDFAGSQAGGRISQYRFLKLDENVNREAAELLARGDCINPVSYTHLPDFRGCTQGRSQQRNSSDRLCRKWECL